MLNLLFLRSSVWNYDTSFVFGFRIPFNIAWHSSQIEILFFWLYIYPKKVSHPISVAKFGDDGGFIGL